MTPIPGPFGMFFSTCLAIVSLQIIGGARTIWLPGILARRSLSAATVGLVVRHTSPFIQRVETILCRDRLRLMTGRIAETLLGVPVFLLAVAIALPIPFGNFLPLAALVVIAMGLMERDGLATLFGILLAAVALGTSGGLLYGTASALGWAIGLRRNNFPPFPGFRAAWYNYPRTSANPENAVPFQHRRRTAFLATADDRT